MCMLLCICLIGLYWSFIGFELAEAEIFGEYLQYYFMKKYT